MKFHATELHVDRYSITITPATGGGESDTVHPKHVITVVPDYENEMWEIGFKKPMIPHHLYTIKIEYTGKLRKNLVGYYLCSYEVNTIEEMKYLAVTHFEPTDARKAFPCFDEPGFKATFTIHLAHPASQMSLSNMPLHSTKPYEGQEGWVWNQFHPTFMMSTYIVAFMVGEFDLTLAEPEPDTAAMVRVWAQSADLNQTEFAAEIASKFLKYYNDFFNLIYVLPKLDLLAVPDFKIKAMENWGLMMFRETELLFDKDETSLSVKLAIASSVAHEIAHMWFGNLVTMKWWTDLWLKEGFATYMASICVDHVFREWNSLDISAFEALLNVFKMDALTTSHPVSVPIVHPREIGQIFDAISYDKGSFLIRMMRMFLGEEVFRHGISAYLKKHQYNNAEQDDLWMSLSEQAHRYHALPADLTVKQIMDTWTLQMGYPLITVTRCYEHQTVTVSQERYLAMRPCCGDASNQEGMQGSWWVPLSYSTAKSPHFNLTQAMHWLPSGRDSITFNVEEAYAHDWIIFNNKASGLYRVNYDAANWELLIQILNTETGWLRIDSVNRAQLLTDALDLAEGGLLDYKIAIRLVSYLRNETELLPWKVGLAKLENLRARMFRTEEYGAFKDYVSWLLAPLLQRFGSLYKVTQTHEESQLLSLVAKWCLVYDISPFFKYEAEEFWFLIWRYGTETEENPIPKEVRRAVYGFGASNGDITTFNYLYSIIKESTVTSEKNSALMACCEFKEAKILKRLLEMSLEGITIRKQDAFIVFAAVAGNQVGYNVAKEFFYTHIEAISYYYGQHSQIIGRYVTALAKQITDQSELDELRSLTERYRSLLSPANLIVAQALETAMVNILWKKRFYSTITSVLRDSTPN